MNKFAGKLYLRLWGFIRVGGLPRPLWPRSDHRLFSLRAGVVFEFRLPAAYHNIDSRLWKKLFKPLQTAEVKLKTIDVDVN